MIIKQGDIIFSYFDKGVGHEFEGPRPVIVIESDVFIKKSDIITTIPLTSNLKNSINDDIILKCDKINNMDKDSVIKVDYITAIDQSRFIRLIGVIDKETLEKIKKYLKKHLDL